MCNRYRISANEAAVMRACGFEPPFSEEPCTPVPEIFPTGKKTARFGPIIKRSVDGNRPLEVVQMEWGFLRKVPSKRDPSIKLDRYVTNARNLSSSMWKPSLANPERRCLVPFTHFAEPHPDGGRGDDGKPRQVWFSLEGAAIGFFAGLWRPTDRGNAFAFCTTDPNDVVRPWHSKAMPVILRPPDLLSWLDGSVDEAVALVKPYEGALKFQFETPRDEVEVSANC